MATPFQERSPSFHRLSQQSATKLSGIGGEYRTVEEEPDVRAISRPRTFDSGRNPKPPTHCGKSCGVCHPSLLVEIQRKKPTRFVRQERVDTDCLFPGEVVANRIIGQWLKHSRLPRNFLSFFGPCRMDRTPIDDTGGRIAGMAVPSFPTNGVNVFPAAKQAPKESDLFLWGPNLIGTTAKRVYRTDFWRTISFSGRIKDAKQCTEARILRSKTLRFLSC
jgi:hypothetical protein